MAIRPSMTVNDKTTIDQMKLFMDQTKSGDRILAKTDKTTNTTLLYVAKKSTMRDIVPGKTAKRKEEAKATLQNVIEQDFEKLKPKPNPNQVKTFRDAPDTSIRAKILRVERDRLKDLVSSVKTARTQTGEHGMTADQMKSLTGAAKILFDTSSQVKPDRPDTPSPKSDGLTLSRLKNFDKPLEKAAHDFSEAIGSKGDMSEIASKLGDALARSFLSRTGSSANRMHFATSDGAGLKHELLQEMKSKLGEDEGKVLLGSPEVKDALDKAFNLAASKMMPNQELATTKSITYTVEGKAKTIDIPHIKIGNTEYEPVGFLGAGGFADVYEYKPVNGGGEHIAYKIAKNNSPDALNDIGTEVRNHKLAYGDGHPNVLEFKAAIRTPDGRIGIAISMASKGDTLEFAGKLGNAIGQGPGKVSPQIAEIIRITMAKDLTLGLAHMQETQEMMHLDFKSPNCLINEHGMVQITDFGNAVDGTSGRYEDVKLPDNPVWVSPESLRAKNITGTKSPDADKQLKDNKQIEDDLKLIFPTKGNKSEIPKLLRSVITTPEQIAEEKRKVGLADQRANTQITMKSDTWSLGMVVMDLFRGTGKGFDSDEAFISDTEAKIVKFAEMPELYNDALEDVGADSKLPLGSLMEKTGNAGVDQFVNALLSPDPDRRPKLSDAVRLPIFSGPGVGSNAVRELIVAIANGDPDEIDIAKTALGLVLNPMPVPPIPTIPQQVQITT